MDVLARLKERAAALDRTSFRQQYQGLYLYAELPGSDAMGFKTQVASASTPSVMDMLQRARENPQGEHLLLRVEKSDRNTWKSRISVGRATNNDLVLRHPSVSKLHAHFFIRQEGSGHRLMINDVGSANGTLVNGRNAGESDQDALPVVPGDTVLFGDVECRLLDAGGVYDRLRRAASATGDF